MSWTFLAVAAVSALVVLLVVSALLTKPAETVYVILWNDGVVGVTRDQAAARKFCDAHGWPDGGHYVRWLPFTVGEHPQVLAHKHNNWGRPLPKQPRKAPA